MTEEQVAAMVIKAMTQSTVQPWYVQLSNIVNITLVGAAGYIAWSAKTFFETFTKSIADLYNENKDKEKRLSHIEGMCEANHHRRKDDTPNG